jgi:hypothetical protein
VPLSAELRWFWRGAPSEAVRAWFEEGAFRPGDDGERTDIYLHEPGQRELGVKKRGDKPGIEIKGLVAPLTLVRARARAELWSKWTATTMDLTGRATITVVRRRRMRKLRVEETAEEIEPSRHGELLEVGCNVELTEVDARGRWSTVGFEAFAPHRYVETVLAHAVDHVGLPPLRGARALSYPAWLAQLKRR